MTEERIVQDTSDSPVRPDRRLAVGAAVLLCATAVGLIYGLSQRQYARRLAASQDQMAAALSQTRAQLEALSAKLNTLNAPPPAARPSPRVQPPAVTARHSTPIRHNTLKQVASNPRVVEDPRWKKLQE